MTQKIAHFHVPVILPRKLSSTQWKDLLKKIKCCIERSTSISCEVRHLLTAEKSYTTLLDIRCVHLPNILLNNEELEHIAKECIQVSLKEIGYEHKLDEIRVNFMRLSLQTARTGC